MSAAPWKHVLWDLDGTLLDTYPATDAALVAALTSLGVPVSLDDVRPLTRLTLAHAVDVQARRWALPEDAIWTAYEREYGQLGRAAAPALPGALEAMQTVQARGGLNLLATHRDRDGAAWRLKAAGLWDLLDDLLSVSDGYPRKPAPDLFEALLERWQLNPAEVLVVGDRTLDIEAGHAAGCPAALLVTPGVELGSRADVVLKSLFELAWLWPGPVPI
ncbi:HAD-IA family hydrolase [Deinococcus sp. KNUC1210]|uniref:HAD-IA family hydrolase n=1 Tax=Deinococcus sp. KNUC1210 TaxID=2917691 RepID=UPI001EF0725A|nr:HAD-IA family hydrolase [Deinococcus sp. KNUC1210]ULH14948.1 HAD-IA family hydrolase [Deinococcus sp. KNUC1210]